VPIADRCHDGSGRQQAADEYEEKLNLRFHIV
jgi:hypothetical protein